MLPGFRFLFVAVVLSLSILVFGLGAAALLRSAHEEFVNLPGRRPAPETVFAQRFEDTTATLAMLRVDTPVPAPANPAPATAAETPVSVPEQPAGPAVTADTDRLGAPLPAISSEPKPEARKPEALDKAAEAPAQAEPPAPAEAAAAPVAEQKPEAPTTETRVASMQPPPPAADQLPTPEPSMAAPPGAAAARIATLGGPEVVIESRAAGPGKSATPAKRVQKHRVKRRRIVRPRIVPPQPATLGFFDPLPAPVGSAGRVQRSSL